MIISVIFLGSLLAVSGQMVQMDSIMLGFVGSQVELRCIFINSNPPVMISQVTWCKVHSGTRHNVAIASPALGVSVLPPFKERVSFKQAAVHHRRPSFEDTTIVFSNLQLSDEASYICEYTTFPAGNRGNMVNLTIFALNAPVVSVSVSEGEWAVRGQGGAWVLLGAGFQVKCSVVPQHPGGFFQLLSPTLNLTLSAVNHSAHFQFTDASPVHAGNYTCVYHLQKYNRSFSSNSSLLIYPGVSDSQLLLRALVLLLLQLLNLIPYIYYRRQATRRHQRSQRARRHRATPEDNMDVVFDQM